MVTYVETIEPRLTPLRPATPDRTADVLIEWTRDLQEELSARIALITPEDLAWQPHPDSNSAGVTIWHLTRWLDYAATRAYTGRGAAADLWHTGGFREITGYEPDGIGFRGLGVLTGYTPAEMRAVPFMSGELLDDYLRRSTDLLITTLGELAPRLNVVDGDRPTIYQAVGSTLQGSFGHVGEIDTLVALRARLLGKPESAQ